MRNKEKAEIEEISRNFIRENHQKYPQNNPKSYYASTLFIIRVEFFFTL